MRYTKFYRHKEKIPGTRTIFGKIFWTNMMTLMIALCIIGGLMFGLLGSYISNEKATILDRTADIVTKKTLDTYTSSPSLLEVMNYSSSIEETAKLTDSYICILTADGDIFKTSSNLESLRSVPKSVIKQLKEGENIRDISHFGGYFDKTVLTIGRPISYQNQVIGGVLVIMPMPMLNKARYEVTFLFLICALITALIAFLFVFLVSRKITLPIKQMNEMAKQITKGDFSNHLAVESNDEIGELAQSLNSMSKSLHKVEEMRSSFIANVSHELRTPMTTISGFIEGILDGTIPPDRQEQYLKIVLSETKRLAKLVSDMLMVSKINSQKETLELLPFDINEMIRLTVIKFQKRIEEKHLEVAVIFAEDTTLVMADKDSINRVLTNLMDNAIKFCDEGRKIVIEVKNNYKNSQKINVSVYNEGLGIHKEEIEYIWER